MKEFTKHYHTGKLRSMASVYLRKNDKILLLYRQGCSIVSNLWIGSAGGHFEMPELHDAKACVLRELQEELGLTEDALHNFSLRYITLRYTDGEIRQNYYFFADLKYQNTDTFVSTEGITKWYSLNELEDIPMPFTARYVVNHYIRIGQYNDELYGGLAHSDGVIFNKL